MRIAIAILLMTSLLVGSVQGAPIAGPDSGGYAAYDDSGVVTYSWTSAPYGTRLSHGDNTLRSVSMPFDFWFYGDVYNNAYSHANGFLTFKNQGGAFNAPNALPTTAGASTMVAGYWLDMRAGSTCNPTPPNDIYHKVTGTAPNRVLVVTYDNIIMGGQSGACAAFITETFQIKLFENGDWIEVHYQSVSNVAPSLTVQKRASVGIQNADENVGLNVASGDSTEPVEYANYAIAYLPPMRAPFVTNDVAETAEDTAVTIDVLANDRERDRGDSMTISAASAGSFGTTQIVSGKIKYTPNANYNGPDGFTYTVKDETGRTSVGTVSVTVTPVNDMPVATDDEYTMQEDAPTKSMSVLDNDYDIEGFLKITAVDSSGLADVTFTDTAISYTPRADKFGSETLSYTVEDTDGATAQANIDVTINSVNDAPTAYPDSASLLVGETVTVSPLDNDAIAPDVGESLTIVGISGGTGSSSFTGTSVTYTATTIGSDTVTYVINDGNGGEASSTISFNVGDAPNEPPTASDDAFTAPHDTAITFTAAELLANDADPEGKTMTATITGTPMGTLDQDGDTFTYTPPAGFAGEDSFVYTVTDDKGATAMANVVITVLAGESPPIAGIQIERYTVTSGQAIHMQSVSLGQVDSVTWDLGDGNTTEGTEASHVYAPGVWTITMTATNEFGEDQATATVTVEEREEQNLDPPPTSGSATYGGGGGSNRGGLAPVQRPIAEYHQASSDVDEVVQPGPEEGSQGTQSTNQGSPSSVQAVQQYNPTVEAESNTPLAIGILIVTAVLAGIFVTLWARRRVTS